MAISWSRRAIIHLRFFNFTLTATGKKLPKQDVINNLSSEELHYLVAIYNWDVGFGLLYQIIESPKCDLGTAIMIFWSAEPDYYFKYKIPPVDEFDLEVWQLLQLILKKVREENFSEAKLEFIPTKEGYQVNAIDANGIWMLPLIVKDGISRT